MRYSCNLRRASKWAIKRHTGTLATCTPARGGIHKIHVILYLEKDRDCSSATSGRRHIDAGDGTTGVSRPAMVSFVQDNGQARGTGYELPLPDQPMAYSGLTGHAEHGLFCAAQTVTGIGMWWCIHQSICRNFFDSQYISRSWSHGQAGTSEHHGGHMRPHPPTGTCSFSLPGVLHRHVRAHYPTKCGNLIIPNANAPHALESILHHGTPPILAEIPCGSRDTPV